MTKRKAQGLPTETIIIFAIVLVVGILVMVFFSGKFSIFSKNIGNCNAPNVCLYDQTGFKCPADKQIKMTTSDCPYIDKTGTKKTDPAIGGPCCTAAG